MTVFDENGAFVLHFLYMLLDLMEKSKLYLYLMRMVHLSCNFFAYCLIWWGSRNCIYICWKWSIWSWNFITSCYFWWRIRNCVYICWRWSQLSSQFALHIVIFVGDVEVVTIFGEIEALLARLCCKGFRCNWCSKVL